MEECTSFLVACNFARTASGEGNREGFVPAISLGQIRVSSLLQEVFSALTDQTTSDEPLECAVSTVLAEFQQAGHSAVGDQTFRDLVEQLASDPEAR